MRIMLWGDIVTSTTYLSKIALDRNNRKLGTIVAVHEHPASNGHSTSNLIVQKSFLFKPSVHVSFKITKILRTDADFVWLDVLEVNFDAWVKQLLIHREQQAKGLKSGIAKLFE